MFGVIVDDNGTLDAVVANGGTAEHDVDEVVEVALTLRELVLEVRFT